MNKKRKVYRFVASILCIAYVHSITAGFSAGTLIKGTDQYVPIELVSPGHYINCFNFIDTTKTKRSVLFLDKKYVSKYRRIIIGNTHIDTSGNQLFYVSGKWISAQKLLPGDTLLTSSHQYIAIDDIQDINEQIEIYEITIAQCNNFYVSEYEILVHNFGVMAGAALWYGGGFEVTAYGAITACGLILGGVAALCKGRQSHHQEQKNEIPEESYITVQPIVGYQLPHNDTLIDLTARVLPQQPNIVDTITIQSIVVESPENKEQGCSPYPVTEKALTLINPVTKPDDKQLGCFNLGDVENTLIAKPQPSVEPEQILVLMAKNNNNKKPKKTDEERQKETQKDKKENKDKEEKLHPHGKYIGVGYHHKNSKGGRGKGAKSPAPKDGQAALDNSVECPKKENSESNRRVGVSQGEIVVLDQTQEGEYHGHVENWDELQRHVQQALENAGLTKNGKIKS